MSSFRKFYRPPTAARQDQAPEQVHGAYKKKIDRSYKDQEGRGPLHLALLHQPEDPHFVEHVIKVGRCDVNAPDKNFVKPLAYAARAGLLRSMKILILHGAHLDDLDNNGLSALMLAASHGHLEVLELLLRSGAPVNLINSKGENALFYAVGANSQACVRSLLKYGSKVNEQDEQGNTVLHLAARAGDHEMLNTILTFHCHGKVQLDLRDRKGRTAIHWALWKRGDEKALEVLLAHGADTSVFDRDDNSAVLMVVKSNKVAHLQALLRASSRRMTRDGRSPVALAALLGHDQCVKLLLDSGLNPNISGHYNQTPLICAAFEGHLDIVNMLLERGANPSGITHTTALLAALSCITPENAEIRHTIAIRLLQAGADPNIKIARSYFYNPILKSVTSALSLAFSCGYVSLVQIVLLGGYKVSYSDMVNWMNDDQSQDKFMREDLMEPLKEYLCQPLPLIVLARKCVRQALKRKTVQNIQDQVNQLPIPKGLLDVINMEELYRIGVERARPVPNAANQRSDYHPFRLGRNGDFLDGVCSNTLVYKTLS